MTPTGQPLTHTGQEVKGHFFPAAKHGKAKEQHMITIGITFETYTPESIETGDIQEPEVWEPGDLGCVIDDFRDAECSCHPMCDTGGHECWWTTEASTVCFRTGTKESRGLHISGITRATRRRIDRLLRGENIFGA
jgi:hypothetical protein